MFFKIFLLSAALEMGIVNGGFFNYTKKPIDVETFVPLYTSLEADVSTGPLYIGGKMVCYFTPMDIFNYYPFQMTFIFNAGLHFDNVQIGYEHSCFHPMQPYATIMKYEIKPIFEGGFNKFFVRIETE